MKKDNVLEKNKEDELIHDFQNTKRLLRLITCHAVVNSPHYLYILNRIYIGILYVLLLCIEVMGIFAFYYSLGNAEEAIRSLHTCLVALSVLQYTASGYYNHKRLEEASKLIKTGVFHYEDEPAESEHLEIRKNGVAIVRSLTKGVTITTYLSAIAISFLAPIAKYITLNGDHSNDPVNPYLSQPLVWPFSTRSTTGLIIANGLTAVYMFYVGTLVSIVIETYLNCAIQLRDQFKILNHSLVNIHTRAIKVFGNHAGLEVEELYESKVFQDCIYECLKKNILHHETLIRMKDTFEGYIGIIFFSVVYVMSIILAANICLLLEKPGMVTFISIISTLFIETFCSFMLCYYGEQITTESSKVFFSLYCTPWISCDKRFKKQVLYMMMHSRTPVSIKIPFLNITACLEAFGNVISAMYSVINLLRQT